MRLDGLIVFELVSVNTEPKCATATATIINIHKSMQGLSLKCTNGNEESKVIINVIGKLILKNYHTHKYESEVCSDFVCLFIVFSFVIIFLKAT